MARQLQTKPSEPEYTDAERRRHQAWCIHNDILIYLKPLSSMEGVIVVEKDGVAESGAHIYRTKKLRIKDERWHIVIWKLYTKYYEERLNGGI